MYKKNFPLTLIGFCFLLHSPLSGKQKTNSPQDDEELSEEKRVLQKRQRSMQKKIGGIAIGAVVTTVGVLIVSHLTKNKGNEKDALSTKNDQLIDPNKSTNVDKLSKKQGQKLNTQNDDSSPIEESPKRDKTNTESPEPIIIEPEIVATETELENIDKKPKNEQPSPKAIPLTNKAQTPPSKQDKGKSAKNDKGSKKGIFGKIFGKKEKKKGDE